MSVLRSLAGGCDPPAGTASSTLAEVNPTAVAIAGVISGVICLGLNVIFHLAGAQRMERLSLSGGISAVVFLSLTALFH